MKGRFENVLARYGQTVTVTLRQSGEPAEVRAFVQPVLKEQLEPPVAVTALGAASEQRWRYLGQGGLTLHPGDQVALGEMRFTVQEARPVYWRDEVAYYWALLRPAREAAA